jgi:hypothetical protein
VLLEPLEGLLSGCWVCGAAVGFVRAPAGFVRATRELV